MIAEGISWNSHVTIFNRHGRPLVVVSGREEGTEGRKGHDFGVLGYRLLAAEMSNVSVEIEALLILLFGLKPSYKLGRYSGQSNMNINTSFPGARQTLARSPFSKLAE